MIPAMKRRNFSGAGALDRVRLQVLGQQWALGAQRANWRPQDGRADAKLGVLDLKAGAKDPGLDPCYFARRLRA